MFLHKWIAAAVRFSTCVAIGFVFAICSPAFARSDRGGVAGEFDYYVLVLSWSPTYCETEARGEYDQQCSGTRPYSFVLHGLWPQYEAKGWPEFCKINERPFVPQTTIDGMLDIMPSPRLVIQQYRKHGTCSGMQPGQYFETARRLYDRIRIPDQFKDLTQTLTVRPQAVEDAFIEANPQLKPDMIEVSCARNRLRDVRICFSKDLKLRTCGENELSRRLCYANSVTMPPVRGTSQETNRRTPSGI